MKKILANKGVQSLIASLICIILGLLVGYIVLCIINPSGAWEAITAVVKNFMNYGTTSLQLKNLGNTLAKTAPLLMCALSILFAYKVGLFNIGASGQFTAGTCACLYAALAWNWHWLPCMIFAIAVGALFGAIVGLLKAYCNVNEVISGIMLNWIILYSTNMILSNVKETTSPYTYQLKTVNANAILPKSVLASVFNNNNYVTIALTISIIIAVVTYIVLEKTKFGYELKATGFNKNAAKYAGMKENKNIIITLLISGALAGLAGSFIYQTGFEQWSCTASSVPAMGFNGIAAAFLGGLNPIATIFSSFFIQNITMGGGHVDLTMYSSQVSDLISSCIIYLCAFTLFIKYFINKRLNKKKENQNYKIEGGKK